MKRIFLLLLLLGLLTESASAQIIRRQLQRIPGFPSGPAYRVGQNLREQPLFQGDGRAAERVMNIVSLFAGGSTELKPVIIVSFSSFDEFRRVLQIVAQQIRLDKGSFDEPVLLTMALNFYERIVGQGFDTSQPLGIVLQTDGVLFYPILFTPLNLDSKMGQSLQQKYAVQLPDGRTVIRQEFFRWPLGELYVQEHNGWAFIAPENLLNSLPDDPTLLLQGLDRTALMAARFDLQNMPALSTRAALSIGEMNAVKQAETEIDKALTRLGIGYIRSLAEQSDFLEYTFTYDEMQNDYVFTQTEIVKPNTERSRLMQERRYAESALHGFYNPENAILASHFNMTLTQAQRTQLEIILDEAVGKHLLTEEERSVLKLTAPVPEQGAKRQRDVSSSSKRGEAEELAAALSQASPEEKKQILQTESYPQTLSVVEGTMPDLQWSEPEIKPEEMSDSQKLEQLFRRIGATYYWGLIGAVRSGKFDGASTVSQEHGILAGYKISEGERFSKAFDSIFEEMQTNFPDLYVKNVQKDYAEAEGFRLTSVVFRLGDFIKNPFLKGITPPNLSQRETRLILGVRNDAVCFAVGQDFKPEKVLVTAIGGMRESRPVEDVFFVYSAYELGQAFVSTGQPDRLVRLKLAAADTNPLAWAYGVSHFTDTTKTITFRASGLLTPSIWRLRESMW